MHPRTQSKLDLTTLPTGVRVINPLGFYDFSHLLKESLCVISDSGTAAEEGIFYGVPNVSLRMATERPETVESGATIISGMDPKNIVESVVTALEVPWAVRYDFAEHHSPSSVVINCVRSQITNFF
jgi:UDP-N-acetylglucosamine 2-epimerase (non-hydrolysing)